MNIKQLNQIPITDFLDKIGISEAYQNGENYWYISPLREPERSPSFKVNAALNRWYDYATQQGGKLFDLAAMLYPNLDASSLILKIGDVFHFDRQHHFADFKLDPIQLNVTKERLQPPGIVINETKPLGSNQAITDYLQTRGIPIHIASQFCEEVYYQLEDKRYFAAGFKNRSGGYELRSQYFKGSSSPKDLTLIENGSQSVCVLEGFMDFLSLLTIRKQTPLRSDFLILNSVSFVDRSIDILKNYKNFFLYLDHDKAGRKAVERYETAGLNTVDASVTYQKFKDLNDYLLDQQARQPMLSQRKNLKRSRGLGI